MTTINRFVGACFDNNVRVVREMISEGVDINEVPSVGVEPTALMAATWEGNTYSVSSCPGKCLKQRVLWTKFKLRCPPNFSIGIHSIPFK